MFEQSAANRETTIELNSITNEMSSHSSSSSDKPRDYIRIIFRFSISSIDKQLQKNGTPFNRLVFLNLSSDFTLVSALVVPILKNNRPVIYENQTFFTL